MEVDLRPGERRKQGLKIKLQEQPFQILASLLENPGEVVSREELCRSFGLPTVAVDLDQGLNNEVKKLRLALGESADHPRFVETLARHGYRFIAPVEERAPAMRASRSRVAQRPAFMGLPFFMRRWERKTRRSHGLKRARKIATG